MHLSYSEIPWPEYALTLRKGGSRKNKKNQGQEKNNRDAFGGVFFHGSPPGIKKAELPVIRQPGCPCIFPQDPRLSAHRLLGVQLLLIKVTIFAVSQPYDQSPRSFKYLPPPLIASALLFQLPVLTTELNSIYYISRDPAGRGTPRE